MYVMYSIKDYHDFLKNDASYLLKGRIVLVKSFDLFAKSFDVFFFTAINCLEKHML